MRDEKRILFIAYIYFSGGVEEELEYFSMQNRAYQNILRLWDLTGQTGKTIINIYFYLFKIHLSLSKNMTPLHQNQISISVLIISFLYIHFVLFRTFLF